MEENGLIERRPDPSDRRAKLIALTEHGEEQASFVRSLADRMRVQIFEGIDLVALHGAVGLLDRIAANIADLEDVNVTA
jgi:MarR family transcriptional regulator for hemolysin